MKLVLASGIGIFKAPPIVNVLHVILIICSTPISFLFIQRSPRHQKSHTMVCKILSCQRYNYYIQKGIDLENVAPLGDSLLKNIQEMVSNHLTSQSTPFERLVTEINEDYLLCVKAAICIYFHLNFHQLLLKMIQDWITTQLVNLFFYQYLWFLIAVKYTFRDSRKDEDKTKKRPSHRLE